jgi:outer membrane protein TolC
VKATSGTTRLRLEVYEGERRRLENDLSTAFQVREAQRDYLAAVDEETRARLDLAIAQTSLLASRGRLLEHYGFVPRMPAVSLEDAPPSL